MSLCICVFLAFAEDPNDLFSLKFFPEDMALSVAASSRHHQYLLFLILEVKKSPVGKGEVLSYTCRNTWQVLCCLRDKSFPLSSPWDTPGRPLFTWIFLHLRCSPHLPSDRSRESFKMSFFIFPVFKLAFCIGSWGRGLLMMNSNRWGNISEMLAT